jgi:hypothetical protein
MASPSGQHRADGRWIGGIILILIGAGLLAGQLVPDIERYAPIVVGLGLLIIFLFTRNAGALIGGCIVTGIGVGLLMDIQFPSSDGSWVPLCLGLGFLGIWIFGGLLRMPEARFWPLVPGGILTFVGVAALGGLSSEIAQYVWPVLLIGIGVIAIISSLRRRREPTPPPADASGDGLTPIDPSTTALTPSADD